jgi:uncharacterized protein YndB with AHSA1/START domain
MTDAMTIDRYGALIEPATLKIERLLPGPIERVWAFLTESGQRRRWLAAGEMTLAVGAQFELVWRNDELTDPPGAKPEGFGEEHRMTCRITAVDPPHRLAFTWGEASAVSFALATQGDRVLLTLIHSRIPNRTVLLNVSAGWHAHLDVLAARAEGGEPTPFWDEWLRLKEEYTARLPA